MLIKQTRVLLVNPATPFSYWGFQGSAKFIAKAAHIPLGLITLAAILPQSWKFRLVDMNFEKLHERDIKWADVIMLTGMIIQKSSIAGVLKQVGGRKPTVIGGPFVSSAPDASELDGVTSKFIGEAEDKDATNELVADITRHKSLKPEYRAGRVKPDINTSPVPRYDLLKKRAYAAWSVQTSRGCQNDCDFCSVTALFGLRLRYKDPHRVVAELQAIHKLGYRGDIFFVDDNFINSPTRSQRIVDAVSSWQERHKHPFLIYTQTDVKVFADQNVGLVRSMVACGFKAVFVGIETVSVASLESVNKNQNIDVDVIAGTRRLRELGLIVYAGFIVGFDPDTIETFSALFHAIEATNISMAMVGVLIAIPGTKLHRQMLEAGRIVKDTEGDSYDSNIIPVMGRKELLKGYRWLMEKLYDPAIFFARAKRELDGWQHHESKKRTIQYREYRAGIRSGWRQGLLAPYRRYYWRFLRPYVGTYKFPRAIAIAIYYHHLYVYTQEVILPRLTAELDTA